MVRMGRGETMSPGVLTWAMDQVAERYAQQDGQTLQAAGVLLLLLACTCSLTLAHCMPSALNGVDLYLGCACRFDLTLQR